MHFLKPYQAYSLTPHNTHTPLHITVLAIVTPYVSSAAYATHVRTNEWHRRSTETMPVYSRDVVGLFMIWLTSIPPSYFRRAPLGWDPGTLFQNPFWHFIVQPLLLFGWDGFFLASYYLIRIYFYDIDRAPSKQNLRLPNCPSLTPLPSNKNIFKKS